VNKSKIAFTEDILLQASTNLSVDKKIVEDVYSSIVAYIHHLSTNTDTVAIFVPNLGTMYMKASYISKMIEKYKGKNLSKYEIYKNKIKNISNHANAYISDSKFHKKSRHFDKNKLNNYYYNNGKSITEIEEFQNKL